MTDDLSAPELSLRPQLVTKNVAEIANAEKIHCTASRREPSAPISI
jgi:hypothetical protein